MTKAYFAHPQALVESTSIGEGTRIWAFAHILPGARIGADCNICDGVFIENDVVVGDRVTVKCGVQLWDGVTLEDDVFVGPNATFTNDLFPRSRQYPETFARTIIRRGASIGANATLLPGIEIGSGAMVGAGAVVTKNVASNAIVVGNPATVRGAAGERPAGHPRAAAEAPSTARLIEVPFYPDERGTLLFGQVVDHIPFSMQRFFVISDVPAGSTRGHHAHREQHQFMLCLRGACTVEVDDGRQLQTFRLDSPRAGVHVPPLHWNVLSDFTGDALLLCLCSGAYDRGEYIEDRDTFRRAAVRS